MSLVKPERRVNPLIPPQTPNKPATPTLHISAKLLKTDAQGFPICLISKVQKDNLPNRRCKTHLIINNQNHEMKTCNKNQNACEESENARQLLRRSDNAKEQEWDICSVSSRKSENLKPKHQIYSPWKILYMYAIVFFSYLAQMQTYITIGKIKTNSWITAAAAVALIWFARWYGGCFVFLLYPVNSLSHLK